MDNNEIKPKFKVGDIAINVLNNSKITIIDYLGNSYDAQYPLYEAIDEQNNTYRIPEDFMVLYKDEKRLLKENKISEIIDYRTEFLQKQLHIKKSEKQFDQLKNIMIIYKYIAQNFSELQDDTNLEKSQDSNLAYENDLFNALVNKNGSYIAEGTLFKHLLTEIEIPSEIVLSISKEGLVTSSVLAYIGETAYFFAPSMEQSSAQKDISYSFSALGKKDYSNLCTPIGVWKSYDQERLLPLPTGIAKMSIRPTILRSLAHEIDDSIYSEDYFVSELQHLNPLINTKDITSGMLYSEIRSLRRALEQNKGDAK